MIVKEIQVAIHVLHQQGKSARAIARELSLARQTVLDALHGKSDGVYGPRAVKLTKLSPYHRYVEQRISGAAPHRIAATVLMRELRERGYDGGISQLKAYLALIRPTVVEEPIVRFETDPGQQMQIDFVVFRMGTNPLRAFTATLGYSRMSFINFTNNERAETWADCLQNALAAFGGVPKTILCDNARSIVLERHAYGEGKHRLHPLMWDIAKHYGFRILLCKPYRAQTKGKIERFHRYVRQSFYVPLQTRLGPILLDAATANREARIWLDTVANVRLHATLQERPCDRFLREREALQPLALPHSGMTLRALTSNLSEIRRVPPPIESLQHPLHTYEILAKEIARQ